MKELAAFSIILIVAQTSSANQIETAKQQYNGNWWSSIDHERRLGFLAGHFCCSYYDLKDVNYAHLSWRNIEPNITHYYENKPDQKSLSVTEVIKLFITNSNFIPSQGKQKKYRLFDGEYWRQSERSHKIGFLEGYVNCWNSNKVQPLVFKYGIEEWVSRIDKWYGININDPSEINEKRVDTKIPSVMPLVMNK
jgi:hypothetical protein